MNHRGSLVVVAVLTGVASGCAGRIGHIELAGTGNTCAVNVSNTIKVKAGNDPRFYGMAWVVVNQCTGPRTVEVYFKTGVTSPLQCSETTYVPEPLALPEGKIGAMACLIKANATSGVYKYSVKVGNVVVDPDLIIKR